MQRFAQSIVNSFRVYSRGTKFGFISYSDNAYIDFGFNSFAWYELSRREVNSRINAIQHRGGSSRRIDIALQTAYRGLFTARGGARQNVRRVGSYYRVLGRKLI